MTWVVDASVAIKWFVREDCHAEALRLLEHASLLHAPDMIVAEVANIAWKKATRREISPAHARAIASAIGHYIPTLHPSPALIERALEIALTLKHPVYDSLYLACADAVGAPLVTADRRLRLAVRGTVRARAVVMVNRFAGARRGR
ncbi:MAG: type II toxin-antitoxin system VapC family toxin [Alphaproteobacteria bacterium]|nr:type II toxin-antitoxin system VapC family toxin [Alphaproteobacteria bacterium]